MKVRELIEMLARFDPEAEVGVAHARHDYIRTIDVDDTPSVGWKYVEVERDGELTLATGEPTNEHKRMVVIR